jgi:hypothetical protein
VAEERLALTERGDVRVQLKSAYRDGATHVVLEPLDFLARLAARAAAYASHAIPRSTPFLRWNSISIGTTTTVSSNTRAMKVTRPSGTS